MTDRIDSPRELATAFRALMMATLEIMKETAMYNLAVDRMLARQRRARIAKPPGHCWVGILSFVYSKTTYERVFAPHIADMRTAYFEALSKGSKRKARWIVLRDNAIVVPMILVHLPHWLIRLAAQAWALIP